MAATPIDRTRTEQQTGMSFIVAHVNRFTVSNILSHSR
jgi:hypothetical protein